MAEEKTDYSKENKERMLAALAVYMGLVSSPDNYGCLSDAHKLLVEAKYDNNALKSAVETAERIPERDIQIKVAEAGLADGVQVYRIAGVDDDRTCEHCAEWQGKTVTMGYNPFGWPTVQDFINSHGFHINCRCSLQELSTEEIPRKKREWMGLNSRPKQVVVSSGCYLNIV